MLRRREAKKNTDTRDGLKHEKVLRKKKVWRERAREREGERE